LSRKMLLYFCVLIDVQLRQLL